MRAQFPRFKRAAPPARGRLLAGVALALLWVPALPADWGGSEKVDQAINAAVAAGLTPGAVVWIESDGAKLHSAAYGRRSVEPTSEAMAPDTIFDCASLTKVLATAPAIMILVEKGKVRLNDRIQTYLPDFRDATRITVAQLLTHHSGLRPVLSLEPPWSGYATGVELALQQAPAHPPGTKFVYSDINYILLAEIVRRVSGSPLDEFARQRIFEPLAMHDTAFRPAEHLRGRIAPTEKLADGTVLRGVVHDPTTRMMGGVSGQAGLFSTAADVARFARMMLNGGSLEGRRVLSPLSIVRMTTPQDPGSAAKRGLGWDIDTPYSSPRGDLFTTASYGHTGFTGPSLWIDPLSRTFVALMANQVHPKVGKSVVQLRSLVASIAAAHLENVDAVEARRARLELERADMPFVADVRTGLDVLASEGFERLRGKKVGLLTNHTGIDRQGNRNIDLMVQAGHLNLDVILTPEHGLGGDLDQPDIGDSVDAKTGIAVRSLYRRDRRRPPPDLLRNLDALVFDMQDVGARQYTYITTLGYALEAAAEAGTEVIVLDRPNPITGARVEGPVLEAEVESFVGYHPLPVRHGMTVGELARMFNAERRLGARLSVVRMDGWHRSLWFDETGLPWVNPSPNIRNLDQAVLYPGIVLLEWLAGFSVGRGTDTPFQFVGADWIVGNDLANELRQAAVPGIRIYAKRATPRTAVFSGTTIDGVQFSVVDRNAFRPTEFGLALAAALRNLYPGKANFSQSLKLIGDRTVVRSLDLGHGSAALTEHLAQRLNEFRARRHRFLLY